MQETTVSKVKQGPGTPGQRKPPLSEADRAAPPAGGKPAAAGGPPPGLRHWRELDSLRGLKIGGALVGYLVTVGIGAILTALLAAAGAAVGLQQSTVATVSGSSANLTVAGAALLIVVLVLAYFAGGHVAGRLTRFSGMLQGFGVWLVGVVVTAGTALAGAIAGSQYNVLGELRLPSIPVNGQSLAGGGAATLVVIAVLTLVAALLGGASGHGYHVRVDRVLAGTGARPEH